MEPITAAANSVGQINTAYGLVAFLALLACALIYVRMVQGDKRSKDLVDEVDKREKAETAVRKMERDAQIEELKNQFIRIGETREKRIDDMTHRIDSTERTLDRHLADNKERDAKVQASIDDLAKSLHQIELHMIKRQEFEEMKTNLRDLEKMVTRIYSVIEARFGGTAKEVLN